MLTVIVSSCSFGQDRQKAEQAVTKYLISKFDKYTPEGFGEFFEQTYPIEVQEKMNTKRHVKYSLVHSYTVDGKKVENEYFHLDNDLNIIGQLSMQQMTDITTSLLNNNEFFMNFLDSIATVTTSN